ncbi:unnamed protein product [Adineta ricciae]|uniref:Uncharacterized protein n=1 Tax=Adineta ricciae TaxID=249248 RepID=A0A814CC34_ADIRI|nr:unnamed protein product [Adineta ricciae]
MIVTRTLYFIESIVILMLSVCILTEQQQQQRSTSQLYHILTSLKPLRPQICQFKFENCIQDSSYADQLNTDCDIYSRLRDCFRSLLDESQCSSTQLKRQYKQAKKSEYEACGVTSVYEKTRSSWYTSSSTKLHTTCQTLLSLVLLQSFI